MGPNLRLDRAGALVSIVFAREKGLNILSAAVLKELEHAWAEVSNSGARVCIIRGEGRAFVAGADINEMATLDEKGAREFAVLGQRIFEEIESSGVISIAAIHGACLGGGCELALACDIRIGSVGMMIGQPEVNIGLIPGFGGSQRLPRVVGLGWALRMILSGEPLDEKKALEAGLITEFGDSSDLQARAEKLAQTILSRGPQALKIAKRLTHMGLDSKQSDGMEAERLAFGETFMCGEAKLGMNAFIEKRSPGFN